ncbi:MAG: MCE family protein [Candidatus Eremiobacteraeota bacterium]|nr:MCE family protein [Candidatus Eremiobacteraeota bacterium]
MTKQAQVGAFAILALLLLFGVFYVITDFGTRHTGYRIGVHFESAAGLHSGALVYFSGVTVGTVDSITLLPDNTVDVILAINRDVDIPSASRFLIQAPLTGDPNLLIVPPVPRPRPSGITGPTPAPPAVALLERRVLPVDQQPQGTNTATVADLLEQGQGEIKRLDVMMSGLEKSEPKLLSTLQQALTNANDLTLTLKGSVTTMTAQLQSSLGQASANIVSLTGTLNDTAKLNSARINDILVQFDATSRALDVSMTQLESLATNKELKSNLLATVSNIKDTTQNIADLTHDLQSVTGDPQTQAQVKNTVANLDATMQRANSLLGELGGTSSVYGVDQGATPYPLPSGTIAPLNQPGTVPSVTPTPALPGATPYPMSKHGGPTPSEMHLKSRLNDIAKNLVSIQFRMSGLNRQTVCCPNPLFTADQGPESDLNLLILPRSKTSLLVGANNIGHGATANAALIDSLSPSFRVGGGVFYSQVGLLGQYNARLFGLEARLINPQWPQLDVYGNINIAKGLQLFVGERALNQPARRFTYGFQTQFP